MRSVNKHHHKHSHPLHTHWCLDAVMHTIIYSSKQSASTPKPIHIHTKNIYTYTQIHPPQPTKRIKQVHLRLHLILPFLHMLTALFNLMVSNGMVWYQILNTSSSIVHKLYLLCMVKIWGFVFFFSPGVHYSGQKNIIKQRVGKNLVF